MQISDKKKMTAFIIAAIFFVFLDRLLKYWAISNPGQVIQLVNDVFTLNLAKNYYIAFSIPFSGPILNTLILAIIGILIYFILILAKKKEYLQIGYLTNIVFGAISNIYDRLYYGFVVDYFDLKYFTIFNIADSMIVVACILLSASLYRKNV